MFSHPFVFRDFLHSSFPSLQIDEEGTDQETGSDDEVYLQLCSAIASQIHLPPTSISVSPKTAGSESLRRLDRRTLYNAIYHELSSINVNQTATQGAQSSIGGSKWLPPGVSRRWVWEARSRPVPCVCV